MTHPSSLLTGRYCVIPPADADALTVMEAAYNEASCHEFDGTLDISRSEYVLTVLEQYGFDVSRNGSDQ